MTDNLFVRRFFALGNRLCAIFAVLLLAVSCVSGSVIDEPVHEEEPEPSDTDSADITEAVNREVIHAQMDTLYLWNDAYRNVTRNFRQSYDDYLNDVLAQMYRAGANLKDGREYNGYWYFYTYITREAAPQSRAKSENFGLGMCSLRPARLDDTNRIFFMVEAVYPDSPADKAGLVRGDIFGKVNGVQLTTSNYADYSYMFYDEDVAAGTYTLSMLDLSRGTITYGNDKKVTADNYLPNPVTLWRIYKIKEHNIGWIVYSGFDADYDDELQAVFDRFKDEGVTDLIFDLRFNGGGSVESCCKTASILAGSACKDEGGAARIFSYERYNDERMTKRRRDPSDYTTYDRRPFDVRLAERYGFEFDKIYIIATSATASASELLVNSLRGVDKEVEIAAVENTNGKDVGMEVYSPVKSYDGYRYTLAPISFQCYNAKGESDYDNGFPPTLKPELNYEGYVPSGWGLSFDSTDRLVFTDYLADAVQSIVIDDVLFGDIEVVRPEKSDDTRSAADTGLIRVENPAAATRAVTTAKIESCNPFKTNMYIVKER